MKICVCSDSHGNPEGIRRMLAQERPGALLYLGDGLGDFYKIELPEGLFFAAVSGNCDLMAGEPPSRTVALLGKTFYLTHGHRERVKAGLDALVEQAGRLGADAVLYGHTHRADARMVEGRLFLCPGALRDGENRYTVLWEEAGRLCYEHRMVDWSRG